MAFPSEHAASAEVGERELPPPVPPDGPRLLAPVEDARALAGELPRVVAAQDFQRVSVRVLLSLFDGAHGFFLGGGHLCAAGALLGQLDLKVFGPSRPRRLGCRAQDGTPKRR